MNVKDMVRHSSLALMVAVLFLSSSALGQKAPQRISFARGATVARANGYLRGIRDEAWFVLRAGAGQHMRVEINGRGATRGMVTFPSGEGEGGPGGVVFDGILPDTGDYRIRVTESSMAEAWRGSFVLKVEILPVRESRPSTSDLEQYVGKYPSELFRRVPTLKTRLRELLGANYKSFFDRMQVEVPIERDDDTIVVRGCMAHQCTIEEAILVIDLADGKPYVALEFNSRFRTFADDRSRIPDALKHAMQGP